MGEEGNDLTSRIPPWVPCAYKQNTPEEAWLRLEAIITDKLLWFNPYRVADRVLLECAERGRWSTFPAITQMLVFHFHDIRTMPIPDGRWQYDGLFFHIGNNDTEHHLSINSLTYPMTNRGTLRPEWTMINGHHLVPSNIHTLERKNVFVSHAICCNFYRGVTRQAYRMHRLYGSEDNKAKTIRESMVAAKLEMLEEVLTHAMLPEYLGNSCTSLNIATPLRQAMEAIRRFPKSVPPTTHITV